jgi:hypothetical protein
MSHSQTASCAVDEYANLSKLDLSLLADQAAHLAQTFGMDKEKLVQATNQQQLTVLEQK